MAALTPAPNPVLVATLVSLTEWINHWREDIEGGLKPTLGSLNSAQHEIVRALASHANAAEDEASNLRSEALAGRIRKLESVGSQRLLPSSDGRRA